MQTTSTFWLFAFSAAFLCGLLGWWLRAILHEKALRNEFALREQERLHLGTVNVQLRTANDLKDADLKKAQLELEHTHTRVTTFEHEKTLLTAAVHSAAVRLQHAQIEAAGHHAKLEAYEEQVLGLRTRNAHLTGELGRQQEEVNAYKSLDDYFVALQQNVIALEEAIAQIEHERNMVAQELEAARQELSISHIEIDNLQTQLLATQANTSTKSPENGRNNGHINGHVNVHVNGHPHEVPLHKPVKMISIADLEALPTHPLASDLKIINGISPFSERKLHEMGMHTIAQVSEWDEDTTSVMNDALGFAPGRIQREGWVNQARHLVLLEA